MQTVSLTDNTGEALKPGEEAGNERTAHDTQHTGVHRDGIPSWHADLHEAATARTTAERHAGKGRQDTTIPERTDQAARGASRRAGKREADPGKQERAARRAKQ
jgi:hypothetical protein